MKITFLACLKQTGKCVGFDAEGNGELKLETSAEYQEQLLLLARDGKETLLEVTIESKDDDSWLGPSST